MTYEEFKKELYHNLRLQEVSGGRKVILLERGSIYSGEDAVKMIRLINLGNYGREDTVLREDTLCVVWKKQGIHGLLHWGVRSVYERFKREGWQGVLPEIVAKIHQTGRNGGLSEAECATQNEHLIIRALNYKNHCEELEESVFWVFGDIALVLYFLAYVEGEGFLTVRVNRNMIERRDVADEVLLTNALLNTYAKMPPRLYYGTDIHLQYNSTYGVFMPGEKGKGIIVHPDDEREGLHGYRVTTSQGKNGAVALFYPGVKERLAEIMDGDYYVGFTGIHEAFVYPARHKVLSELKAAMHRTSILRERKEMLSTRVYRYSCSRKELIEV